MLSAAFTIGLYVVGHFNADLAHFENVVASPAAAWLAKAMYYLLPNLAPFDVKLAVVHGQPVAAGYVAADGGYGVLYMAAMITLAYADLRAAGFQVAMRRRAGAQAVRPAGRSPGAADRGRVLLGRGPVAAGRPRPRTAQPDIESDLLYVRAGAGRSAARAGVRRAAGRHLLDSRDSALRRHAAVDEAGQAVPLLYPLLDLTTDLDPRFTVAYRFGAIFLAEPSPDGPGRADLAIGLLEKGLRADPRSGSTRRTPASSTTGGCRTTRPRRRGSIAPRASRVRPGGCARWRRRRSPQGGDRRSSRQLWRQLYETSEHEWVRNNAQLKLAQLDALDQMDALAAIVRRYTAATGRFPESWAAIGRGLAPRSPDRSSGHRVRARLGRSPAA